LQLQQNQRNRLKQKSQRNRKKLRIRMNRKKLRIRLNRKKLRIRLNRKNRWNHQDQASQRQIAQNLGTLVRNLRNLQNQVPQTEILRRKNLPEALPALPEALPALPKALPALPKALSALPEALPALPEVPVLPRTELKLQVSML
jgi:hypothetical protein